jgi:hypothetical protein
MDLQPEMTEDYYEKDYPGPARGPLSSVRLR